MASELSRLIDDELVKFERRPSIEEKKTKRRSFEIKSPPPRQDDWLSRQAWGRREWWTWKRVGYAVLAASFFFVIIYIYAHTGATKSEAGSSSLQSKTQSSPDTTNKDPVKSQTRSEPSSFASIASSPKSGSQGLHNATQSLNGTAKASAATTAAANATSPTASALSVAGPRAGSPLLQPSEAVGPLGGAAPGPTHAAGPQANSSAPGPSAFKAASAPELLSPGDAPAPNALAALPPVSGISFNMGGKTFWGRKMR